MGVGLEESVREKGILLYLAVCLDEKWLSRTSEWLKWDPASPIQMAKTQALKGDTNCLKGILSTHIVSGKKGGKTKGRRRRRGEGGRETGGEVRLETSSLRILSHSVSQLKWPWPWAVRLPRIYPEYVWVRWGEKRETCLSGHSCGVIGNRERGKRDPRQLERAFMTRRYINFKSRGNLFERADRQRVGGRSTGDGPLGRGELGDVTCFTLI